MIENILNFDRIISLKNNTSFYLYNEIKIKYNINEIHF